MATTPTDRVTLLTRRTRVDIDTAVYPLSQYQQLMGIAELKKVTPELRAVDDETHDDAGAYREQVTGYNWRLELKIKFSKNAAGVAVDPVQAYLLARFHAAQSGDMAAAEFGVRFYDRHGFEDDDSGEGRAYVKSWSADGGNGGTQDVVTLVIQGQGPLTAIDNPLASPLPVVSSITPTGGGIAGGTMVRINGAKFSGATSVKFGATAVAAGNFVVNSDSQITCVAPAHAAGSVQVNVTTPAGVSADVAADDYVYA